jgi:MoxR-like ATPase
MSPNDPVFELVTVPDPEADDAQRLAARAQLGRRRLPPSLHDHRAAARHYRPSSHLRMAINLALNLGAPLLLTGEPGTGKTQVAEFLAWYFTIPVFKFQVKSNSSAEDLRYDFDAVGYLHWAQGHRTATETPTEIKPDAGNAPPDPAPVAVGSPAEHDPLLAASARERSRFLTKGALWLAYLEKTDAVLLIDEIDKAPRDFPNDLLHELDQHCFRHPFLGVDIRPSSGRPPILVVTSNDERRLPDAFLRRCIFHRIEITDALVKDAVRAHADDFPNLDPETLDAALACFWRLRELAQEKKPSTAELLAWLCILSARGEQASRLRACGLADLPGLGVLLKDQSDLDNLR